MSWWKPRRSSDAFTEAIPTSPSNRSIRSSHSYANHSIPASPMPEANWNNESSLSLPTYAEAVGVRQDPAEVAARKQKLANFLQEMQYDEELRLTEARKPPGMPSRKPLPQSNSENQISEATSSTTLPPEDTLKVPPVLSPLERRRTLTNIQEISDLFPEPEMLGPKTSDLYKRRPTSAPLRNRSSDKDYTEQSLDSFYVELDSIPISDVIELPTISNKSSRQTSLEYGHEQFNTLPGEPFPLIKRQAPSRPSQTIPELAVPENDKEHHAFRAFLQPDFDPRTGLETTPIAIHYTRFPSEENLVPNTIST